LANLKYNLIQNKKQKDTATIPNAPISMVIAKPVIPFVRVSIGLNTSH